MTIDEVRCFVRLWGLEYEATVCLGIDIYRGVLVTSVGWL